MMSERSEGYDEETIRLWDDTGWSRSRFPDSKPTRTPNGEPLDEVVPDVTPVEQKPLDPKPLGAVAKQALDWM
jgi:hypothetical protein